MILLVRHAAAVSRSTWSGDDDARPLSSKGAKQVASLTPMLAAFAPRVIMSSPSARCVETVGPLAAQLATGIETSGRLREGRGDHTLDLVLDAVEEVVMCTHRDVIEHVLDHLGRLGWWGVPSEPPCAKASVWLLAPRRQCTYLVPP